MNFKRGALARFVWIALLAAMALAVLPAFSGALVAFQADAGLLPANEICTTHGPPAATVAAGHDAVPDAVWGHAKCCVQCPLTLAVLLPVSTDPGLRQRLSDVERVAMDDGTPWQSRAAGLAPPPRGPPAAA